MSMMTKTVHTGIFALALAALTACGGGGGGGGTSTLATGTFLKSVNDTSSGGSYYPFENINNNQKVQHLFTADQIQGSGNIEKLTFTRYSYEANATTCPQMSIRIGHTSLSELTTTFADNVEEGKGSLQSIEENATIVIPAGAAGETFDIDLETPFAYNGVDNLVIEFERAEICDNRVELIVDSSFANSRLYSNTGGATGNLGAVVPHTTFTFAGGVSTHQYDTVANLYPFYASTRRTQNLYTASDINGSGPITGIAFQLANASVAADYNVTVKMGHIAASTLSALNDFDDNFEGSASVMADNLSFSIPDGLDAGDWFWIPLNGSFTYNGTDNLLVDVDVTGATASNSVMFGHAGVDVSVNGSGGATTPLGDFDNARNIKLRFNGATMDVVPESSASNSQVLGSDSSGGTVQSLYRNTDLGTSGRITAVYVRMRDDAVSAAVTDHQIHIGHTTKTTLELTDNYLSNMDDDYLVAYSGTTQVSNTLKRGDWLKIQLATPFRYDARKNLAVFFAGETNATNYVYVTQDSSRYPSASVGGNSLQEATDTPSWDWDGMVGIKLEITK